MNNKRYIMPALFLIAVLFCSGCSSHKKGFKPHNKHNKDCGCSHWSNNSVPVRQPAAPGITFPLQYLKQV
jgi:predicted component of type VI protein secretion system